jgi:hypothetical protein
MLVATLLFSILLQPHAVAQPPSWSGELVLTVKGSGAKEITAQRARITYQVDRMARGRILLNRTFKGAALAGMPDGRDTTRYESWIGARRQPLDMVVSDSGTYHGPQFGFTGLDTRRYLCPAPDTPPDRSEVGPSILQFDYATSTYIWEVPRIVTRCLIREMRRAVAGPASYMSRPPWPLVTDSLPVAFDIMQLLSRHGEWYRLTGSFTKGATELVLSRSFTAYWPVAWVDKQAPLQVELVLVLKKSG